MSSDLTDAAPTDAVHTTDPIAVRRHRRFTRWTHWINFPLLAIMIWSGLRIYWADVQDPYGFGVGLVGWHWFDFLPSWVNDRFNLERKLAAGMAYHFTFGWLFTINGLAYGIYTWWSGEWRRLLPDRYSPRDAVEVVKHDLHIGDGELPPQGRYNAAQRISYTFVIVMGALAVLTGLAIYKPTQLAPLTWVFGGYEMARTIHFAIAILFIAFFVVHVLQVIRAGWGNFASMVTGYQRIERPAEERGEQRDDDRDDDWDEEAADV